MWKDEIIEKIHPIREEYAGIHYRALAVEENDETVWFWIGTHAEYDRLLRGG